MEKIEKLDKSIYDKFIRGVQIESINLIDLSIKSLSYDVDEKEELLVDLEFQNEKFKSNETNLTVSPRFILKVSKMKDGNKITVFEIEFEYKLEYRVADCGKTPESYLELFVKRNVPINIWPYARELISSMTTRMGYPALIIEPLKG